MKTELLSTNQRENATLTMSSREIALLINKNHADLCRSIERLSAKGIIKGYQPMAYTHPQNGQTYYEYHLEKRDCLVVVAQNCPEFTAAIVDRWQELEQKQVQQLPSYSEALRQLADKIEESEQKSLQIASIESYFRNGISPFEFVKGLNGVNSLKIGAFLVDKNWLYQDGNHKRVKSYARDQYLTEETTEISQHGKDPFVAYKPILLKKGAAKLYEWYTKRELPMKANWNGVFTQDKVVGL
ncbi:MULTISPECIES: Rha family transcriptional regulator [Glaesserella]|uniref:Phage regulatory protein n=1 Tax=Glaesserella australis TaxID=2094024 RepID=A0A328BY56_9PAST|nr:MULTISPECIES: Rha family transcriptional regulator [Glaesserella]AUI67156.1 phage regulatory protein [Glaesserella sp. 15-184]RAL19123.1 phage regulatory protein [Glaesserella australis]